MQWPLPENTGETEEDTSNRSISDKETSAMDWYKSWSSGLWRRRIPTFRGTFVLPSSGWRKWCLHVEIYIGQGVHERVESSLFPTHLAMKRVIPSCVRTRLYPMSNSLSYIYLHLQGPITSPWRWKQLRPSETLVFCRNTTRCHKAEDRDWKLHTDWLFDPMFTLETKSPRNVPGSNLFSNTGSKSSKQMLGKYLKTSSDCFLAQHLK
jgi:hypothetical protein